MKVVEIVKLVEAVQVVKLVEVTVVEGVEEGCQVSVWAHLLRYCTSTSTSESSRGSPTS